MKLREEPSPLEVDDENNDAGVTYEDDEELACGDKESLRDAHRWELDPASAEDYRERMRHEHEPDGPAAPLLHMTHAGYRPGHH
jgi:uncharacterized protein DUF6335